VIEFVAEPLRYGFFRYGLAAAVMAGALCSLVGVYMVLRNMSYIGHGLSHAIFGGAVSGYMFGGGIYVGAAAFGIGGALAIAWISRRRGIGADAAIGIVSTAAFALGVAMISTRQRFTRSFEATLFRQHLVRWKDRDFSVDCSDRGYRVSVVDHVQTPSLHYLR